MIHNMNLQNTPFEKIKSGKKTVEMRLYDEKRQWILSGDTIEFTNESNNEKLYCKVCSIYTFKDFKELYKFFDKKVLGYSEEEKASHKDMLQYYSKKDIKENGTVGIVIKSSTFEEYSKELYEQKVEELKNKLYVDYGLVKEKELKQTKRKQNVKKQDKDLKNEDLENDNQFEEDFDDEDLDNLVVDDFSDYSDYNDK